VDFSKLQKAGDNDENFILIRNADHCHQGVLKIRESSARGEKRDGERGHDGKESHLRGWMFLVHRSGL
jgi:hypothetical protein